MIPSQTSEVFMGVLVASCYSVAVLVTGVLILVVLMGREVSSSIRAGVGVTGFVWLGFMMGQGVLGTTWLILSLARILYPGIIWVLCVSAWLIGGFFLNRHRRQVVDATGSIDSARFSFRNFSSWYFWVGMGVLAVGVCRFLIALTPSQNDDAVHWYLAVAKVIAFDHKIDFQPFTVPHSALYPLQVEMHWAALFAIANETAVTTWDYLCGVSFLAGVGLLARHFTNEKRVVLLAVLMILSTPGFYDLLGAGKVDNAAAQYAIAAFLWLALWPSLGRRTLLLAGLYLGWGIAARYTNIILMPALALFTVITIRNARDILFAEGTSNPGMRFWITNALVAGFAATITATPMLIKNWMLVGCPLAPLLGCREAFWAPMYGGAVKTIEWILYSPKPFTGGGDNISAVDLLLYPFVWTFGARDDMLGNISPLFIGLVPTLLFYWRLPTVRPTLTVGIAGIVSIAIWLLIKPFMLYTRWFLVPLGLFAIPLSTSVVAAVREPHRGGAAAGLLLKSGIFLILLFLMFQSRAAIYAVRYIAGIDSRAKIYEKLPFADSDVAIWLNTNVEPNNRVAVGNWGGYSYLLDSRILLRSESAEERQWLKEQRSSLSLADIWLFLVDRGFNYIVIPKDQIDDAIASSPAQLDVKVSFTGRNASVIRITQNKVTDVSRNAEL